jgi:hypothetical protein
MLYAKPMNEFAGISPTEPMPGILALTILERTEPVNFFDWVFSLPKRGR